MSDPRIVRVEYQMPRAKPAGFADPMPRIVATFDDGARKELFDFYRMRSPSATVSSSASPKTKPAP